MDLPVTIYRGKTNSYSSKTITFITSLVPWIVSCCLSLSHISIIFSPTLQSTIFRVFYFYSYENYIRFAVKVMIPKSCP